MTALNQEPRTWTDLETKLNMSKATLSSRLKELRKFGVVEKQEGSNGTSRYGLTARGQDLLHRNGVLHSPILAAHIDRLLTPNQQLRNKPEETYETCPACHSRDSALWSFDAHEECWECRTCRHKWKRTRKQ